MEIRPGNTTSYNVMLSKVKDRIARARTRQVILEIHNLVRLFHFIFWCFLTNRSTGGQTTSQDEETKWSSVGLDNCETNPRARDFEAQVALCRGSQALVLGSLGR